MRLHTNWKLITFYVLQQRHNIPTEKDLCSLLHSRLSLIYIYINMYNIIVVMGPLQPSVY